ncbi:hypothetical protein F183_A07440 [Bryobacterales bacterium F-183]|nr:hypothetical protein F183_A07440 [Bryobacterales bacterium F-183]
MPLLLLPALLLTTVAQVDPAVVDKLARESMQAWKAPGVAIAIVDPTRTIYQQGYGVKTLGKPDPVTPKTVFAIASTTKAFTATLIGMLVDEGKLDWDDPVRKHLPDFRLADPSASELVTVRDLLSHRTGLARNDSLWYGSPWDRDELMDRVTRVKLTKPFRSTWQYQNLMFLAAGQVAVAASGAKSWEELVQQRIVGPLGMASTTYSTHDVHKTSDAASPHAKRQGKVTQIPWLNLDNIAPAGSMNSNVEDLARWVRVHLNGGKPLAITEKSLRETHTPQMHMQPSQWGRNFTDETNQMSYGLGWFLQDFRGEHVINHGGAIDGFRAQMLPKQKLGIIVLANLGSDNMPEALRWKIVDHILKAPAGKDWDKFLIDRGAKAAAAEKFNPKKIPDTKPSLPLTSYVGDYTEPAYGLARVSMTGKGALQIEWAARRATLEHLHFDTFAIRSGALEGLVSFRLNGQGDIESLRFQDQDFARVAQPPVDYTATAKRLVGALKLSKGEKVIVRFDPDYMQGLTKPVEDEIRAVGAIVAASLPYAAKSKEPAISGCGDFVKLLDDATVYFWMPFREESREVTSCETRALIKWLDAGGAHREIHFHWNGGSVLADGLPTVHPLEYDRLYADALDIDYAALSSQQDAMIAQLRKGTVHVRTPAGTDISFRVGDRPFNKQDGDASAERMKTAKVRVDREIEFPAGVLRVAPLEETANGVIVVPEGRFGTDYARNVRLTIEKGKVTRVEADSGRAAVQAALKDGGDTALRFREFGVGFNPKLVSAKRSKVLPYFAYGSGMVRMSLGDNEELGGAVRGGAGYRRWFFFPDATIQVTDVDSGTRR